MKILLVGSSGGHLLHLVALEPWWSKFERCWVTFKKDDAVDRLKGEEVYWCRYPTNRNFKNLFLNTLLAIEVLFRERPSYIISSGAGAAIPYYILGKIFGCKLIFIEVFDRIDNPTITGRIAYKISDLFLVFWSEQLKHFPNAKLVGGLFGDFRRSGDSRTTHE